MADTNLIIVSIADMAVSSKQDDVIVTYALGSCLGMVIYDPVHKVGGMLHAMLADSSISKPGEPINPHKYVNTGIPRLFKEAYKHGAQKKNIIVKMAGCSRLFDDNGVFNIGKRNYATARKILWKNNVLIDGEHCLKTESITLSLEMKTGEVCMRIANKRIPL